MLCQAASTAKRQGIGIGGRGMMVYITTKPQPLTPNPGSIGRKQRTCQSHW